VEPGCQAWLARQRRRVVPFTFERVLAILEMVLTAA
jgi:hypothetical protein